MVSAAESRDLVVGLVSHGRLVRLILNLEV